MEHASFFSVNLSGENINTIKRTLPCTSKKFGLAIDTEKTEYIIMSDHQNSVQNHNIKINGYFENV
jgi:hypothetical protein